MITLQKVGDALKFTFTDNPLYLQNGTIEVPVNSLTLVTDNSGIATFKKSASNDIFVCASYDELGMSKSELESWFKENAVGGGGGGTTPEEVQQMIDESISGKVNTSSVVTAVTSGSTDSEIPTAKAVYDAIPTGSSITIDPTLDTGSTNAVANSAITTSLNNKANKSAAVGGYRFGSTNNVDYLQYKNVNNGDIGTEIYYPRINGKGILTNNYIWAQNNLNFSLVETSAITSAVTSASTDSEIPTAKAVYDAIPTGGTGGGKAISAGTNISVTTGETADTVSCTLPIYWDLKGLIYDRQPSVSLPANTISRISKPYSVSLGYSNSINGERSVAMGTGNYANGYCSVAMNYCCTANTAYTCAEGDETIANNYAEHASGKYNVSSSASTTFGDSGNTLFSVGNGTADDARHNAFEIRQNGDIY